MAAAVVGTAYVRIRGVTTGLGGDIQDAVDDAGGKMQLPKTSKAIKDSVSKAAGDGGTEGGHRFNSNLRKTLLKPSAFQKIRTSWSKLAGSWGDESGKSFASRFNLGMKRGFSRDRAKQRRAINKELFELFTVIKLPTIAWLGILALPALGGAIKIAVSYIGALAGQIGYLLTAIVGVSTALAGVGAGMAVAILPLLLAFKAETPGMDKFKESIKEQAEAWMEVGAATQEYLLPALDRAFGSLGRLIPRFTTFGSNIGRIVGRMAELSAAALTSEENLDNWGVVFGGSQEMMQDFSGIVQGLADMLPGFLAAIMPLSERLTESFAAGFDRFTEMINAGVESGSLIETLTLWYDRAELFGGALMNIVRGLWEIFKVGGDEVEPMFANLDEWSSNFLAWTKSIEGKNSLRDFFANSVEVAQEVNSLLGDILSWMVEPIAEGKTEGILSFIAIMKEDWIPLLKILSDSISEDLADKLLSLATALTELLIVMNESGALGKSLDVLGGIVDIFDRVLNLPGVGGFIAQMIGWGLAFSLLARSVRLLSRPFRLIGNLFVKIVNLFSGPKLTGLQVFGKILSGLWKGVVGLGKGIMWLLGLVGGTMASIFAAAAAVVLAFVAVFFMWDDIEPIITKVWGWIHGFGTKVVDFISNMLSLDTMNSWIAPLIEGMWAWLIESLGPLGENLEMIRVAVWDWISGFIPGLAEAFVGAIAAASEWVKIANDDVIGSFGELAQNVYDWASTFIADLPNKFISYITGWNAFGSSVMGAIVDGLNSAIGGLSSWGSNLMTAVKNAVYSAAPGWLKGALGWLKGGSVPATAAAAGLMTVAKHVQEMGRAVRNAAASAVSSVGSTVSGAWGWATGDRSAGMSRSSSFGLQGAAPAFAGGVPNSGMSGTSLIVKIGETDITDIVDARVSESEIATAHALFVRRH